MGVARTVGRRVGRQLAPRVTDLAPGFSSSFVREALHRAIAGVGPLPAASVTARRRLKEADGDVEAAIKELTDQHVRYAGVQGLATNLGGLVTMAVTVPANLSGLTLIQCRMVAGIAHLRGYDLDDARVRNAILVTLLGEKRVDELIGKRTLPAPPMALATAPVHDVELDPVVSRAVADDLVARVTGTRLATTVGRRVPVVGGVVGMGADGWATYKIAQYADAELRVRRGR